MPNIQKTLATLVKYNQGFFKSEKQADFLLKATGGVFTVSNAICLGNEYSHKTIGKSSKTVYTLDSEGVSKVARYNSKGCKVTFDRNCPDSIKENLAHLKSIKERENRSVKWDALHQEQENILAFSKAIREHKSALMLPLVSKLDPREWVETKEYIYIATKVIPYEAMLSSAIDALEVEKRAISY